MNKKIDKTEKLIAKNFNKALKFIRNNTEFVIHDNQTSEENVRRYIDMSTQGNYTTRIINKPKKIFRIIFNVFCWIVFILALVYLIITMING